MSIEDQISAVKSMKLSVELTDLSDKFRDDFSALSATDLQDLQGYEQTHQSFSNFSERTLGSLGMLLHYVNSIEMFNVALLAEKVNYKAITTKNILNNQLPKLLPELINSLDIFMKVVGKGAPEKAALYSNVLNKLKNADTILQADKKKVETSVSSPSPSRSSP